ncbi:hypothetical protein BpHYR1_031557 [Brachionus plicatilis]|uniref:Uncharacterized protein n=1 Tax=Brachionus plicatilis TaxID=10195 RepID=A0A3M7PXI2_BRAPC|nr:hypothetical protein BpHYR1_031557 [Brachionus plicatilis]
MFGEQIENNDSQTIDLIQQRIRMVIQYNQFDLLVKFDCYCTISDMVLLFFLQSSNHDSYQQFNRSTNFN